MSLYGCEFIEVSRNIILVGGTGTGKTHLAIAIGSRAAKEGFKVRFFNLVDLANQLEREKEESYAGRLAKHLEKIDVLILDELGYLPFSKNGGQLIFHMLSKLHAKTSLIITTNLAFSEWTTIFHDKNQESFYISRNSQKSAKIFTIFFRCLSLLLLSFCLFASHSRAMQSALLRDDIPQIAARTPPRRTRSAANRTVDTYTITSVRHKEAV